MLRLGLEKTGNAHMHTPGIAGSCPDRAGYWEGADRPPSILHRGLPFFPTLRLRCTAWGLGESRGQGVGVVGV